MAEHLVSQALRLECFGHQEDSVRIQAATFATRSGGRPKRRAIGRYLEPAERFTLQALKAQGVTIDAEGFGYASSRKHKIDCNAVYRLMHHGLWWPILENKRLAIVSGHADAFAARLTEQDFVRAAGGEKITWTIASSVSCPPVHEPKNSHWPRMWDELFSSQWDLLLTSAGSLSTVFSENALRARRSAIDLGYSDKNFSGSDFRS